MFAAVGTETCGHVDGGAGAFGLLTPPLAPTAHDVVLEDGTARLLHFRGSVPARPDRAPVLLVPSMINRWYVLDLRPGYSVVEALVAAGFDTWCLDWGAPNAEDRYLDWDAVVARLSRMARRTRRETGHDRLAMLGYCMGGTLTGIHAALEPDTVQALINLLGPFDFTRAGELGRMTDARWFDPEAIASAGNMTAEQMQQGFVALRPTATLAKWVGFADRAHDPRAVQAFAALEAWASDNVSFPAAAYVTYIRDLYQENRLVRGEHAVRGKRVNLAAITCPVLTIATASDTICPLGAAKGLNEACGATDSEVFVTQGGHVGAVVGSNGPRALYPKLTSWLSART